MLQLLSCSIIPNRERNRLTSMRRTRNLQTSELKASQPCAENYGRHIKSVFASSSMTTLNRRPGASETRCTCRRVSGYADTSDAAADCCRNVSIIEEGTLVEVPISQRLLLDDLDDDHICCYVHQMPVKCKSGWSTQTQGTWRQTAQSVLRLQLATSLPA